MVPAAREPVQRLLLYSIPWKSYDAILHALEGRHLRITYDRGKLEIMTVSYPHEFYKKLFARMIEIMTLELNMAMAPGGSTTFRRELMERGLEPDECYWITNTALMKGKLEFDADTDPPPDLALEIDITNSSLDRMGIYGALGTPEIWRFDGERLTVHHLVGAKYRLRDRSRAFPFLPVQDLLRFVKQAETEDQTTVMRAFTQWVRDTLLPAAKPKKTGKSGKNNGKSPH
jgi:Uma2 family endonuclease